MIVFSLDASTKQNVVLRLLLPAVKSNVEAVKAALKQCMEPAVNTLSSVLMDAWLESVVIAADIEQQRIAVQHLIVGMAAMHKQQQGEVNHARLVLKGEQQHRVQELQEQGRAVLNRQQERELAHAAGQQQHQQELNKQLVGLKVQQQVQAATGHRCLGAAAAADKMVRSAAAAAQATSLDASTKQGVVLGLLLLAVKSNVEAAKAALKQCMEPACNTLSSVLVDVWLESVVTEAGIDQQRTAVQHLIVGMAEMHNAAAGRDGTCTAGPQGRAAAHNAGPAGKGAGNAESAA